jgi:hypothetical protein
MKLIIAAMLLLLAISLAGSVQEGATDGKMLLLGSLSKNAMNQVNISNETNFMNQTNITNPASEAIDIKNPMSTIPVTNKVKGLTLPNCIQANAIAYRFTT